MRKKQNIARTSAMQMIDFIMAQSGISRQQATIAFDAIVLYMRQHPTEPLHKIVGVLFGNEKDEENNMN